MRAGSTPAPSIHSIWVAVCTKELVGGGRGVLTANCTLISLDMESHLADPESSAGPGTFEKHSATGTLREWMARRRVEKKMPLSKRRESVPLGRRVIDTRHTAADQSPAVKRDVEASTDPACIRRRLPCLKSPLKMPQIFIFVSPRSSLLQIRQCIR